MGKGIALEYKKKYPEMYQLYKSECDEKNLQIGKLMLYYGQDYWILMFPTKENSQTDFICRDSMETLVDYEKPRPIIIRHLKSPLEARSMYVDIKIEGKQMGLMGVDLKKSVIL